MANLLNDRLNESDDIKEKRSKKKKVKSNKPTEKSGPKKIAPKKEPVKREEDLDEKIEALTGEDIVKEQKKLKRSKHKYYFVKIFMQIMKSWLLLLLELLKIR
ncbi:MAG: hypothetical protein IJ555_04225 [Ruminococcus sp.]|nr:hypothetical protein [Ruminococcus sp.]